MYGFAINRAGAYYVVCVGVCSCADLIYAPTTAELLAATMAGLERR